MQEQPVMHHSLEPHQADGLSKSHLMQHNNTHITQTPGCHAELIKLLEKQACCWEDVEAPVRPFRLTAIAQCLCASTTLILLTGTPYCRDQKQAARLK